MRTLFGLLLLVAPSLLAQTRGSFPDAYTPSVCADPSKVCLTFNQSQFHDIAALRGFDIGQEWIDAHWVEISTAMRPMCAKVATCFATPGNSFTFCNDILIPDVLEICDRYPAGSKDREKCRMFAATYWAGHDRKSKQPWTEMQECAAKQPASSAEKTFDFSITPATIGLDYSGDLIVAAVDRETRVPVEGRIVFESREPVYSDTSASGLPTTFFPVRWRPQLIRTPNAEGHFNVRPPEMRIEVPGYRTVTLPAPVEVPKMIVEMNPPAAKLKRGVNKVTISARDAATGEPVEARVMLGPSTILGNTNQPIELPVGKKREEIWVTSLYHRYSDVVVAK
jgi:hypothetical protein